MAPSARSSHTELDMDGDEFDFGLQKTDRKVEAAEAVGMRGENNNGTDIFFFFWVSDSYAVNFADPKTAGGEEEASANQREFAGAADFTGGHGRELDTGASPVCLAQVYARFRPVCDGAALSASPQIHSKMENAEVLEMTVKKVEDILKNQTQGMNTSSSKSKNHL